MTDVNEIVEDCDSGHDGIAKGESGMSSFTEEPQETDFKDQADVRYVKTLEAFGESGNDGPKEKKILPQFSRQISEKEKKESIASLLSKTLTVDFEDSCDGIAMGELSQDCLGEKTGVQEQTNVTVGPVSQNIQEDQGESNGEERMKKAGISETQGPVAVPANDDSSVSAHSTVVLPLSENPQQLLRDSPHEIAENEGYNENSFNGMNIADVKKEEDIDIMTMGYSALILKNQFGCTVGMLPPVYLVDILKSCTTSPITKIKRGTNAVQIHYIQNHFVVSAQINGTLYVCDSLNNPDHKKLLRPQLNILYEEVVEIEYVQLQSQEGTRLCGCFAAANAYKLLENNSIPGDTKFIMPEMRNHLHSCLKVEKMQPFPEDTFPPQNTYDSHAAYKDIEIRDNLPDQETVPSTHEDLASPQFTVPRENGSQKTYDQIPKQIYERMILDCTTKTIDEKTLQDFDEYLKRKNITNISEVLILFSKQVKKKINSVKSHLKKRGSTVTTLKLKKNAYSSGFISCYLALAEANACLAKGIKRSFVITQENKCHVINPLLDSKLYDMASWSAISNDANEKLLPFESFAYIDVHVKPKYAPSPTTYVQVEGSVYTVMDSNSKLKDFLMHIDKDITTAVFVDGDNCPNISLYKKPKDTTNCTFFFFNKERLAQVKRKGNESNKKVKTKGTKHIKIAPVSIIEKDSVDCNIVKVARYLLVKNNDVNIVIVSNDTIFKFIFLKTKNTAPDAKSDHSADTRYKLGTPHPESDVGKKEQLLEIWSDVKLEIISPSNKELTYFHDPHDIT